jgi:hypothetical protein
VVVSSFDVEATVAVGRDRPEFLAVAQLAADLGRPIGARDVLQELLGPLPDVLGWRVIERSVSLGLLDRVGKDGEAVLSEAGRHALGHGEVLVPEEGIWRFFLVDDPLVPTTLVHVQRLLAEPVRREREAAKDARTRGVRPPQTDRPPELLRRCRGAGPQKSVQNGHLFQLIELAENGAMGPQGELRLVFTWAAEASTHLSGDLPSGDDSRKPVDMDVDLPEVVSRWSHETLWKTLVTHATRTPGAELERWRTVAGKLVVPSPFQTLPAAARHSFHRDIDVPASDLQGLGRFEPTVLKNVDIVPVSETDAQDWLTWLQWEAINDYVTPSMLEQTSREQLRQFPYHQPRPLHSSELLAKARIERNDRAWFLLGPSDLGLWS